MHKNRRGNEALLSVSNGFSVSRVCCNTYYLLVRLSRGWEIVANHIWTLWCGWWWNMWQSFHCCRIRIIQYAWNRYAKYSTSVLTSFKIPRIRCREDFRQRWENQAGGNKMATCNICTSTSRKCTYWWDLKRDYKVMKCSTELVRGTCDGYFSVHHTLGNR